MDAQEQVFRLWRMLDDIDTLDDACRDNDAAFRALVRDVQRKRFDVLPGPEFESLWRVYGPNAELSGAGHGAATEPGRPPASDLSA